jgi:predicted amidophosphoribosyltransferase
MFVICPNCWRELETTPAVCEKCGAHVDLYSQGTAAYFCATWRRC